MSNGIPTPNWKHLVRVLRRPDNSGTACKSFVLDAADMIERLAGHVDQLLASSSERNAQAEDIENAAQREDPALASSSARNAQALPCQPVDPKEVAFNASLAPPTADALQEAYHEGYNDALEDMGVGNGK